MFQLKHRPSPGNVNTPFGPRPKPTPSSPAIHYGQDYGWGNGSKILAAADGVVKEYARAGAYGNRLVIDHGDWVETWYCHLDSSLVRAGDRVRAGQHVAWMGATGNVLGKHLHFELRIHSRAVDPEPYFARIQPAAVEVELIPLEEDMATQTFIAAAWNDTWYVTDGLTKRPLAPGENQLLVDLGVVKWPDDKVGNVKLIPREALNRIPTVSVG